MISSIALHAKELSSVYRKPPLLKGDFVVASNSSQTVQVILLILTCTRPGGNSTDILMNLVVWGVILTISQNP